MKANEFEATLKVLKVIRSCYTVKQISGAFKYICLWEKMYKIEPNKVHEIFKYYITKKKQIYSKFYENLWKNTQKLKEI